MTAETTVKPMKILLTGANGYVGRRLLQSLAETGHQVVCVVRNPERMEMSARLSRSVEVIKADLLSPPSLSSLPRDVDAAYYLVHSMGQAAHDFARLERESAQNFSEFIAGTSARQIIYLGGLSHDRDLSPHFRSRQAVARILVESRVPTTVLRAGIIIGSGSASFEIIRDLVEKLPVMVAPRWLRTRCQPIAIRDVIFYLTASLGNEALFGQDFDIGGPDVLNYQQMLLEFAAVRGLRRIIIPVPVLTPRLSSYWLYFVTSVSFRLAFSLVESMKNEAVCSDSRIQVLLPHKCLTYRESLELAFARIDQDGVISSWKDAWVSGRLRSDLAEYVKQPEHGCLVDERIVPFQGSCEPVLDRIWTIGGENGWYYANGLWWLRGVLDKLVGGVGLRRGRTSPRELHAGDALDFWRVLLADRPGRRLLLYAEMKVPGEAWLEFTVLPGQNSGLLKQRAVFRPRGLWGRLYWYALLPVHLAIFRGMARRIAGGSEKGRR
jgi:uncharacterized protein YbjT (DUF2867 family)